ncbi:chemotaxis protein CheW [bacterium BMS3Bbin08]|nr:chemotaxis protein CheW [bacterium BMS3Bbin08]
MDIARIRKKLKAKASDAQKKALRQAQDKTVQPSEEEIKHGAGDTPQANDTEKVDIIPETPGEQKPSEKILRPPRQACLPDRQARDETEQADTGRAETGATEEVEPVTILEILVFKVSNEDYAIRISDLQEVLNKQKFVRVPRAPAYLLGITSVRGKILPVVDLRKRLELSEDNEGKEKIIILSGEKEPIGILVGAVSDVQRFPEDGLLPPPSTLSDEEKRFIEGVVKIKNKFVSILKVDEILGMEEL